MDLIPIQFRPHIERFGRFSILREGLSDGTYHSYVTQIRDRGTRESVPYRRVISALHNYEIFLERRSRSS